MTYPDQCLERADKITKGNWKAHSIGIRGPSTIHDFEFIEHSQIDVPELARRFKKACDFLRATGLANPTFLAQELEAPLEQK